MMCSHYHECHCVLPYSHSCHHHKNCDVLLSLKGDLKLAKLRDIFLDSCNHKQSGDSSTEHRHIHRVMTIKTEHYSIDRAVALEVSGELST